MLTLTMEGQKGTFYVNGEVAETKTDMEAIDVSKTYEYYLGIGPADPSFMGACDELSIFNQTLTAEQVKTLYDNSKPAVTP